MNNYNYNSLLKKSKITFPTHQRCKIRLKKFPSNPFASSYIQKFIENKDFPDYELYIHDFYFSLKSINIKNFEPVKFIIDEKLWIEFYFTFDFVEIIKECD